VLFESADRVEVDLVVALLETHAIPCLVRADRYFPEGGPWQTGPLASHRILVRADQLGEARAILDATVDAADWPAAAQEGA
jgi:hypothetical protein